MNNAITTHTIGMLFIDRHGAAAGAMANALSGGDYVARLERALGERLGKKVVALSSADAALHTALMLCGVRAGDYVIVPTFTFYSDIATVSNIGAVPVFVDCDPVTRCVSAAALETAILWAELQNKPISAAVISDAFGAVADFDTLVPLCKAHGVPTVEFAVGAYGGEYKGSPCGGNCDFGVIALGRSALGGGGAVVLGGDDEARARELTRQRYTDGESFDYRLNNVVAAIDHALLDTDKKLLARRRANLAAVCSALDRPVPTDGDGAYYALVKCAAHAETLRDAGFDVKLPPPAHTLPRYADNVFFEHEQGFCVSCGFEKHCLIGMDISLAKRLKLIRMLRIYSQQ